MPGTLFVVGTPIGNLGDLTDRVRETLASVDVVAAEDTRRTGRLLASLGIERRLVSLFEGNERERTAELLSHLREGRDVALVSDAGMPLVSDPGYRIVRACADDGVDVRVVPGPSAVTAALAISGLPTDRFAFEGFLPRRASERLDRLRAIADDDRTLVVFEAPGRVERTLAAILEVLGERRIALCRELTKLHEEVVRGRVSAVLAAVDAEPVRGEVVLVIEGRTAVEAPPLEQLVGEARELVAAGMRKRDAAREVARRYGASANVVYEALVG